MSPPALMQRSLRRLFPHMFQGSKFGMPHPDKAHKGGEDAMMLLERMAGVADGVGGWSRRGVDPGEYSRALLKNVEGECIKQRGNLRQPTRILRKAYDKCKPITGSATCCLVTLEKDNSLIVSNLGDSGALIYRPSENRIIFKSEEQCHDFNFPKQLGTNSDDMPEHCDVHSVKVELGDIILVATDGVFDNLFDEDIVQKISNSNLTIDERNTELVKSAFILSLDPHYKSPFAVREREHAIQTKQDGTRPPYNGGKPDDISAVLVEIVYTDKPFMRSVDLPRRSVDLPRLKSRGSTDLPRRRGGSPDLPKASPSTPASSSPPAGSDRKFSTSVGRPISRSEADLPPSGGSWLSIDSTRSLLRRYLQINKSILAKKSDTPNSYCSASGVLGTFLGGSSGEPGRGWSSPFSNFFRKRHFSQFAARSLLVLSSYRLETVSHTANITYGAPGKRHDRDGRRGTQRIEEFRTRT
ncbi:unnamed protein product [Amoebophrya sp. A25]|nr:unnamed protein product [Amoebophrya sp. A25]|eukprot:GSA25T00014028001.1